MEGGLRVSEIRWDMGSSTNNTNLATLFCLFSPLSCLPLYIRTRCLTLCIPFKNNSFWSYELCKRLMTTADESSEQAAAKILICGGIAGIITWVSIFPLDVIKTRLQVQGSPGSLASGSLVERQTLLRPFGIDGRTLGTLAVAKEAYRTEGFQVFYRGLGVCSLRAFIVNAVQVCNLVGSRRHMI